MVVQSDLHDRVLVHHHDSPAGSRYHEHSCVPIPQRNVDSIRRCENGREKSYIVSGVRHYVTAASGQLYLTAM
jgi:hypothetical protein